MTSVSLSTRTRGFKNSLAKWLITLGGISVLFTLVLIFMYLLYVIKPIFESAEVEPVSSIALQSESTPLTTGVDELKELAYQISDQGLIEFYQIKETDSASQGKLMLSEQLSQMNEVAMIASSDQDKKLLVTEQGQGYLVAPRFNAKYSNNTREIIPAIDYPISNEALILDEEEQGFKKLSFAMTEEKAVFVGFTQDNRLIKTTFISEDEFSVDDEYETVFQQIELYAPSVDDIAITPDLTMAFIRSGSTVYVYHLDDEYSVDLKTQVIATTAHDAELTTMALLSGGSSLLLADAQGQISQWFEISTEQGREFKHVRSFSAGSEAIVAIYPEQYRKSFYTMTASGDLNAFFTTSEANLWQGKIAATQPKALAISPRADALVVIAQDNSVASGQSLTIFDVHNEHPEVTWQALWQEVWYEGYPEPDYIWQSTSGSDDFEAKFSLVPISFGTIKAALYAMLFAVPIALTAAIYTAYFMTPTLRKKVKPTIELMEALPTVILGFLAGLWLAPLMEKYLPAIFLLFIFLPLATILTAFVWHNLPREIKEKLPETLAPLILIPVMILAIYAAFALSPLFEVAFFGGDMRQYITNDLGINFDQRNALVVGIAMGFAVIPTIFSMAEDAIFSVPSHLTSGSLALGATQWQTLVKVVLLTASPGIFSAVMMGLGRAVGETMIVLMATGNTPILDWSIFQGMRTLAANIAVEMPESEVGSSHYRILFLAAFVLFVFTFVFNTLAEFIRQRLREKYSSM
ncbi:ABC transporter permease subunit [Litorilituus sediminis]|uniref:ABC transporter permease subunit n=2 Tax=Litorilituus sediminis TaxID=718192 RepID=A0A4P6PCK3_9GAMM|nr:ABC transporter permease subunit [Litorilituus sediminis]